MRALSLNAAKPEEVLIKDYLESNASETLAEKINNGVRIEKDGKILTNKKTLETFMRYACEEARKQAEKGANFACVSDETVCGWAIHYFEEDSVEGTLYNEDGTEHKPVAKPVVKTATPAKTTEPKIETVSMFDMLDAKKLENFSIEDDEKPTTTPPVLEQKVPSFLFELFGDALKVEVG